MNLNIKYFGVLAEITNRPEEVLEFSKTTVAELLEVLFEKYPELRQKDFQVAQNSTIVTRDSKLTNSEVALLPPFSGG